jgi:multidrug efflux pump subunit AcrB
MQSNHPRPAAENLSMEVLAGFALIGALCMAVLWLFPLRTFYPNVSLQMITIKGELDISRQEMLTGFTTPVEEVLSKMSEIESYVSQTENGFGAVLVTVKASLNTASIVVRLRSALKGLKVQAEVRDYYMQAPEFVALYFTSTQRDLVLLQSVAAEVETSLKRLSTVQFVETIGIHGKRSAVPSTVRFDGEPAVMVTAYPNPGADVISFRRDAARAADRLVTAKPGLRVHIPEKASSRLSKQMYLLLAGGLVGLIVTTLLLLAVSRNRKAAFSFAPLMIIVFAVTSAIGMRLGIGLNFVTLTAYLLSVGCAFTLGGTVIGFYRRSHGGGIHSLLLPLGLAVFAAGFVCIFPWTRGSIIESTLLPAGLAFSAVLVLSVTVFAVGLPHWTRVFGEANPRPIPLYRRFVSALFAYRRRRVLAWLLPLGVIIYMVLFFLLRLGTVRFLSDQTSEISISMSCAPGKGVADTRTIERKLESRKEVEHVRAIEGLGMDRSSLFSIKGPEYAGILATLRDDASLESLMSQADSLKEGESCDVSLQAGINSRVPDVDVIYISGNDSTKLHETAKQVESAVSASSPLIGLHLNEEPKAVYRRNGRLCEILSIESYGPGTDSASTEALLKRLGSRFPGYTLSLGNDRTGIKETFHRMMTTGISITIVILIIHIFLGIYYRSFLPILTLFSPIFLLSGMVLFEHHLSVLNFLSLPAPASLLGIVVFSFLQVQKERKEPLDQRAILDSAEQLFRSTLPPFLGFTAVCIFVCLTLPSLRSAMLSMMGGMLVISYFVWVLMPIYFKQKQDKTSG